MNTPAPAAAPKKNFRITSTMFLDWPQHGFVLHATESGKTNDFESPDDVPAEVRSKLTGFIRSGHVRFFDLRPMEHGEMPVEITPRAEDLEDDGTHPEEEADLVSSAGAESPVPNANKPSPNAPIPQNVASSQGATGDGAAPVERAESLRQLGATVQPEDGGLPKPIVR